MMKKIILICFANVLLHSVNGQTFVNNGATVAVTQGGLMIVRTDGVNTGSGSLENIAGTGAVLKNAGELIVEGSFVNDQNAVADGFGTNTGQYRVQGDWDNKGTFNADNSTVTLYGSQQAIKGVTTTFFNLRDTLPSSVKTQETDAAVSGIFTMYASEHATANYYLTVLNSDPAAVVQNGVNDAFVSSTGNGRLIRNTNQKAEYIFPTGINENGPKIREASITPANATARAYSVRFADYVGTTNTTTTDGYDTAKKSGYISVVNDDFYHIISANGNTDPADLAIYFDPTADAVHQSIGRWEVTPEWQDLRNTVTVSGQTGSPRYKVVKSAWIPTVDTAHALVDTIAVKRDFNFPSAFVADGQGIPNENTYFSIINQADLVTLQDLSVFNRWGEMVFDSKREGTKNWNGHFNGKLQPQGNYVYRAVVTNNTSGKQYPLVTGNVSLLW
jgi:gliding motility-associated-like protein